LLTTGWSAFPIKPVQQLADVISGIRERLFFAQKFWERFELGLGNQEDNVSALMSFCRAATTDKKAFEEHWDQLVEALSEIKLTKSKTRGRSKKKR
jgi:hypothetical protein